MEDRGYIERDEDIDRLRSGLSNWGRWGQEDQLGTLNLIGAEQRARAVALARSGRVLALGVSAGDRPLAAARHHQLAGQPAGTLLMGRG